MSAPRSSGSTVSRVDGDTPGHQRDTGTGVEWDTFNPPRPTPQQMENEGLKGTIVSVLAELGTPTTIRDLQKCNTTLASLSNQRISALLTQLIKAEKVVRTEVKGKAHFALAE